MDWRALLHNRWVWVGGAGAAGLGALALWRRRSSSAGAAAGSTVTGDTAGYQPGGVGYFDSTGTDIAAQLGQYGRAVDQQLAQAQQQSQAQYDQFVTTVQQQSQAQYDQFVTTVQQQSQAQYDQFVTTVQQKLDQIPTAAPPSSTNQPSSPTYSYVTVQEGNHVDPLLAQIHAYQPNFTLADLQALNPGIRIAQANSNGYISPSNPDRGGSIPVFNVGKSTKIKIPGR